MDVCTIHWNVRALGLSSSDPDVDPFPDLRLKATKTFTVDETYGVELFFPAHVSASVEPLTTVTFSVC